MECSVDNVDNTAPRGRFEIGVDLTLIRFDLDQIWLEPIYGQMHGGPLSQSRVVFVWTFLVPT